MSKNNALDYSAIDWHSLFDYSDGKLYWKTKAARRTIIGSEAGTANGSGYLSIMHKRRCYKVHRIIYTMFNGLIDEGMEIDHINRDRQDNRLENLRVVTRKENSFNTKGKGAYQLPSGNWGATIGIDGKSKYLGTYTTEAEAKEAYKVAKAELHKIGE